MEGLNFDRRVEAVRRFNRLHTRKIGVLQEHRLYSPFSLAEARVIYELAQGDSTTASGLVDQLGLDRGYLSRILQGLHRKKLVDKRRSEADGRQTLLSLSGAGQKVFAELDAVSQRQVGAMLEVLSVDEQDRLVAAMGAIESLLGEPPGAVSYILRPHRAGDLGWIVHRHGLLYGREYGWGARFEALVAGIVAEFGESFDAKRERCWIAEKDGENVGSIALVRKSKTVAQLRLLLVEPKARGLGIGKRLVQECVRFATDAGYRKITLWTDDILLAARRIYEDAGFVLVSEEPHQIFGEGLVGQRWEMELQRTNAP